MSLLATASTAVVALLHLGFLVLEMFLWNKPIGRKIFKLSPEFAAESAPLAANQGLYNGFLAAGLLWSLAGGMQSVVIFFLCCVVVAGIYGALTVSRTIFFVQALPALVALALIAF